jgi:paraquat-inducible protein A
MTEVLMIGILITIVKMTSLAKVVVQPGLFAFGALTLMLAIVVSFDPKILWNIGEHLPGPRRPAQQAVHEDGAPLLACHSCGLVGALHRRYCAAARGCIAAIRTAWAAPGLSCWRRRSSTFPPTCCR